MNNYNEPILPPANIGIIGGGQLGQMMALAAKAMGYHVGVLDPTPQSPAGQVADFQIVAEYDDQAALSKLATHSDVLTYEFENVDQESLSQVEAMTRIPQGINLLTITSHRLREKDFCKQHHLPVTPYASVKSMADLEHAIQHIGQPGLLKTVEGGYDGHGQFDINDQTDWQLIEAEITKTEWIYELKQAFVRELSVMVTRDGRDEIITFPVSENRHQHHILHTSIVPAQISTTVAASATEIARQTATALDLRGVLGIELFELDSGELMINELAPRPHNSGHYSIEACNVSQFDAHIRSICGLPIPPIRQFEPAVMVNLLGDHLTAARQDWVHHPEWHLHDYGKKEIRDGRKMGHITVTGPSLERLLASVSQFS
ncbi:phosphoribosylaminoimidazole carboxylase ATPase subunit [Secundilactobacillus odoratitofui DSM 19909 = JCM 15043]|uniref:N5-carboxyaminoimidazole ribonucleotide synthase n=1 Tax=Secundilactobacillus odoratitofui DSM 19909 = JCM 15043 TaxID=1423776 RepID=A0A0R1LX07_9LACO|nr:5-(carboxyamino)imidazole ribonucleotide synthase [Secundilactobacillus odoratitofui]KRK97716.1 phosphoribosylaminoimidazole carboxylase ATPase subunit [Secundilactobacillus odoratitofui DSM 19909 = JCM 15043]